MKRKDFLSFANKESIGVKIFLSKKCWFSNVLISVFLLMFVFRIIVLVEVCFYWYYYLCFLIITRAYYFWNSGNNWNFLHFYLKTSNCNIWQKKEQLGLHFQWILTTTRSYLNAAFSISFEKFFYSIALLRRHCNIKLPI